MEGVVGARETWVVRSRDRALQEVEGASRVWTGGRGACSEGGNPQVTVYWLPGPGKWGLTWLSDVILPDRI